MKKNLCFVTECADPPRGVVRLIQYSGSNKFTGVLQRAFADCGIHVQERPPLFQGVPWCKWLDSKAPLSELTSVLLDHFENVVRVEQDGGGCKFTDADGRPLDLSK